MGDAAGSKPKDATEPTPKPAAPPPTNPGDSPAPDKAPTELVLRKLQDLIRENKITPELERDTGMSRSQMEQFVKKFENAQHAPVEPGRPIEVKPEPEKPKTFDPNRK